MRRTIDYWYVFRNFDLDLNSESTQSNFKMVETNVSTHRQLIRLCWIKTQNCDLIFLHVYVYLLLCGVTELHLSLIIIMRNLFTFLCKTFNIKRIQHSIKILEKMNSIQF